MSLVRIYLVIFGISILTALGVYYWIPDWRFYLVYEDNLIENLSAGLFLISFLIGVLSSLKNKTYRKALIAVAAVSLLGFLDELSFGARIYNIGIPRIYGVPIDSAHDLIKVIYEVFLNLVKNNSALVLLASLIAIIIVNALLMVYRSRVSEIIRRVFHEPPYLFASFFVVLLLFSIVIDLEIIYRMVLFMIEEILEMNAALALLFCGLSLQEPLSSNKLVSSQD